MRAYLIGTIGNLQLRHPWNSGLSALAQPLHRQHFTAITKLMKSSSNVIFYVNCGRSIDWLLNIHTVLCNWHSFDSRVIILKKICTDKPCFRLKCHSKSKKKCTNAHCTWDSFCCFAFSAIIPVFCYWKRRRLCGGWSMNSVKLSKNIGSSSAYLYLEQ